MTTYLILIKIFRKLINMMFDWIFLMSLEKVVKENYELSDLNYQLKCVYVTRKLYLCHEGEFYLLQPQG